MTGHLPTFSRWATAFSLAKARFSYRDSLVARGAVWTLAAWLIGGCIALLLVFISDALREEGSVGWQWTDLYLPFFMVVFIGSPIIAFITGCALSGRSAGFLSSLWRGLKACFFLIFALLVLAQLTLASSSEKAGLAAAIFLGIALATALAGLLGGFMRWVANRSRPHP